VEEDLCIIYFNGAPNQKGFGIGILSVSAEGAHIVISVKLDFKVTNNMPEYEACIIRSQATTKIEVKTLRVYGDSNLIINQISKNGRQEVKS